MPYESPLVDEQAAPLVTALFVTFGCREVVELTLRSFRHHTPEACEVLVLDNGSEDDTFDYLQLLPWLRVFSRSERGDTLGLPGTTPERAGVALSHGAALDWLIGRVRTKYFVTIDSDVEFLAQGWLTSLVELAQEGGLSAIGELEPAIRRGGYYAARLGPHVLLGRTETFLGLPLSLRPMVSIRDPDEARRWSDRGPVDELKDSNLREMPAGYFYATGALAFQGLVLAGAPWAETPASTRSMYHHFGHMSWQSSERDRVQEHEAKMRYIRQRLQWYRETRDTNEARAIGQS